MEGVLYYAYLKKRGKNPCLMKNLSFIDSLVMKLLGTGEKIKFITKQTGF